MGGVGGSGGAGGGCVGVVGVVGVQGWMCRGGGVQGWVGKGWWGSRGWVVGVVEVKGCVACMV